MAYSNEKIIQGYPGKEPVKGVKWFEILDSFNPKTLDQKYLDDFARRNQYLDQYVDLLFFNRKLNCLMAVELKTGKFKTSYLGERAWEDT